MKIDALTGLRFFAALVVLGSHLPLPEAMPRVGATFLRAGYNGVTLFFVLSGFVLAWTYADRLMVPDRIEVWNFAVARFARIAPLYLASLAFVVTMPLGEVPDSAWTHVLALQTWSGDLDAAYALNGPAWSIGVETFLYALCPLLLCVLSRLPPRRQLWVLGTCVAALVSLTAAFYLAGAHRLEWSDPASAHRWLYRTPVTRLVDFAMGISLALMLRANSMPRRWAPAAQWVSTGTVLVMMSSSAMLYSVASWDLAYAVVFACLIWSLAAAPEAPVARFLSVPLVVRGGLISFAFYLFHVPLIQLVDVATSSWSAWLATGGGVVILVLLVATGAHVLIELPAQRWIRGRLSLGAKAHARERVRSATLE